MVRHLPLALIVVAAWSAAGCLNCQHRRPDEITGWILSRAFTSMNYMAHCWMAE